MKDDARFDNKMLQESNAYTIYLTSLVSIEILFYSVKVHDTLEYDVKILDREEIKITFQFFYLHVLTNDVFCLGANSTGTENFFRER